MTPIPKYLNPLIFLQIPRLLILILGMVQIIRSLYDKSTKLQLYTVGTISCTALFKDPICTLQ